MTKTMWIALLMVPWPVGVANSAILYWTDTLGAPGAPPRADNIQRWNGSVIDIVVDGLANPQALALDIAGGKIYWTDDLSNKVQRANLDGSNVEDLITGVDGAKGIALDSFGRKMYWADNFTDQILRADLDGTNVQIVAQFTSGSHALGGVALDLNGGKIYWADNSTGASGRIYRRNLDGSGALEAVISSTNHGPDWLALDPLTNDIFWASEATNTILRNNDVIVTGINNVRGIAFDEVGRQIYWTSLTGDKIERSNLDGSGREDVVTGLGNPHGIAISNHLAGVPEPAAITTWLVLGVIWGVCWHLRRER